MYHSRLLILVRIHSRLFLREARKLSHFITLLEKEDDLLYRVLHEFSFPPTARSGSFNVSINYYSKFLSEFSFPATARSAEALTIHYIISRKKTIR